MSTETLEDARQRRAKLAAAKESLAELAAERRLEALRRHEQTKLAMRNVAVGFRNAARQLRRLWVTL